MAARWKRNARPRSFTDVPEVDVVRSVEPMNEPGPLMDLGRTAAAEAAITSRTRVIIAVHLSGQIAPMEELAPIAEQHGLVLTEDAAQMHVTDHSGTLTDMRERVAVHHDFLSDEKWGQQFQSEDRMLRNALRSTSREALWCSLLAENDGTAETSGDDFRHYRVKWALKWRIWRQLGM